MKKSVANEEQIKVSVIVPCFNSERYLERCLKSIIDQTYKEIGIIVVNDGSYDGTAEICERYAGQDKRIRVIHKKNEGLVRARKTGLRVANGDYITFVDSDDYVEKNHISTLVKTAIETQCDIVAAGAVFDYGNQSKICGNALTEGGTNSSLLCCRDYYVMGIMPYMWNKLFYAPLIKENAFCVTDEITVGEDVAFLFPAIVNSRKTEIISSHDYHYCIRRDSLMRVSDAATELNNVRRLNDYLADFFRGLEDCENWLKQLKRYTVHNLLCRCLSVVEDRMGESDLFPFKGVYEGDRIIIYGAGAFGRAVSEYVRSSGKYEFVLWVDRDAHLYREIGVEVSSLSELVDDGNVKVIVSILDKRTAEMVKSSLIEQYSFQEESIFLPDISVTDEEMIEMYVLNDFSECIDQKSL